MVKISYLYIEQSQHDTVSRICTCTMILYSVCVPVCAVRVYVSVRQCVHTCVHAVPFKMLSVLPQARKELFCNPGSPNCEVPQGAGIRGWGLSDAQMHSDVCETSDPAPPTSDPAPSTASDCCGSGWSTLPAACMHSTLLSPQGLWSTSGTRKGFVAILSHVCMYVCKHVF